MDNIEKIKVDESVQRVADAISSYLNEKQNVKLDEWTVSDVEIAMKKKYGKVDKTAIEKLKKKLKLMKQKKKRLGWYITMIAANLKKSFLIKFRRIDIWIS